MHSLVTRAALILFIALLPAACISNAGVSDAPLIGPIIGDSDPYTQGVNAAEVTPIVSPSITQEHYDFSIPDS